MNTGGDGLDAGIIAMTGGYIIIHGTTRNMDGFVDYSLSAVSGGIQ